uniref:Uncharacterized protein n=1 Tax=Ackermannviridae sp. TaxID=2831612 RepID=A0A8S5RVF0_9CAUD|nr:MAG TPA: hypothetical protein [Ackermannviridae sp.]
MCDTATPAGAGRAVAARRGTAELIWRRWTMRQSVCRTIRASESVERL